VVDVEVKSVITAEMEKAGGVEYGKLKPEC